MAPDVARITHEKPVTPPSGSADPLDALVLAWEVALREADHAPRTVTRYGSAVRSFLAWAATQERRPWTHADLTPIALVGYRRALQRTAAPSTVNTHLCALRGWCTWLETSGHLTTNPASRLKLVKRTPPDAPPALSDSAVNAVLRAAQRGRHPDRDTALVQLLLQTGLRLGECQALTWGDVLLGEKSGTVTIRAGKGNKARTVPLNGSARAALATYAADRLAVAPTLRAVAVAWPPRPRRFGAARKGNRSAPRPCGGPFMCWSRPVPAVTWSPQPPHRTRCAIHSRIAISMHTPATWLAWRGCSGIPISIPRVCTRNSRSMPWPSASSACRSTPTPSARYCIWCHQRLYEAMIVTRMSCFLMAAISWCAR